MICILQNQNIGAAGLIQSEGSAAPGILSPVAAMSRHLEDQEQAKHMRYFPLTFSPHLTTRS